jgi:hypothetical protein
MLGIPRQRRVWPHREPAPRDIHRLDELRAEHLSAAGVAKLFGEGRMN